MTDWELIYMQASKFKQTDDVWTSFIEKKQYRILTVEESKIVIKRISGGNDAELTKKRATDSINKLKSAKRLNKTELISQVACEVALIKLHPSIHWDESNQQIFWEDSFLPRKINELIDEATDDELIKIKRSINQRVNQGKFRIGLLKLYDSKCCISRMGPDVVLKAAHIWEHSKSGTNKSENGLLLRSDLHDLFDQNLLLIHPRDLKVFLDPKIKKSYYSKYEGVEIEKRLDGLHPNVEYLTKKWNGADWTDKI